MQLGRHGGSPRSLACPPQQSRFLVWQLKTGCIRRSKRRKPGKELNLVCTGSAGHDREPPRQKIQRSTHLKYGRKGNMAEDQQLICSDCGQNFTFTAEDQEFFRERGYSAPKRCKTCRQAKKNEQAGGGGGGYHRNAAQSTAVTCSGCGQQTTVPFEPRGDRPVYCQNCFQSRKTSTGGGARRGFGKGR